MAVQQMIIDAVAAKVGLSLATLSYTTRVVAGEAYQARLDGFFGVRYEVRALRTSRHSQQCQLVTLLGRGGTWPGRPAPRACCCPSKDHLLLHVEPVMYAAGRRA